MKKTIVLFAGLASLNSFAQEIPADAGNRLLKRLGIEAPANADHGTKFYRGKNHGDTCIVQVEFRQEDKATDLKFISAFVSVPGHDQGAIFQGRFSKERDQTKEFKSSDGKLYLKAEYNRGSGLSPEAGFALAMVGLGGDVSSLADIEIRSDKQGQPKSIEARSWADTFIGRMKKDSASCDDLKPLTDADLNDPALKQELASTKLGDRGAEGYLSRLREELGYSRNAAVTENQVKGQESAVSSDPSASAPAVGDGR